MRTAEQDEVLPEGASLPYVGTRRRMSLQALRSQIVPVPAGVPAPRLGEHETIVTELAYEPDNPASEEPTPGGTTLAEFLTFHRAQISPVDRGYPVPRGRGRKAPGLTQEQAARESQMSRLRYMRIERGQATPSPAELDAIAEAFAFGPDKRVALYLKALGREPDVADDLPRLPPPHRIWSELVPNLGRGETGVITYLTDAGWDLVSCNPEFRALFPNGEPPGNTLEWMLWLGVEQMPDHERSWLIPALAQFDQALSRYPGNQRLQELMRRILADPKMRRLLKQHRHLAYEHPDGDIRPFVHAGTGEHGVLAIGAAQPLGSPGSRVVFMRFLPGMTPETYRRRWG